MSLTYPQLDQEARAFLLAQVQRLGSVAAVARELGYSRPAVSLALAGKYTADVGQLRAKLFEAFSGRLTCPHLSAEIDAAECKWRRTSPCPTSRRADVVHWLACKTCPLNPDRKDA